MLRMMSGSSARFVLKIFVSYYFFTYLFRRVFLLVLLVSQRNNIFHFQLPFHFISFCYVDGNNVPENLWFFLVIKLLCYKRTYFESLNLITLHWVWVNLVICCNIFLNIGLYNFPPFVSHVTPWMKWFLRNLVVIFSIFSAH
jgi:hypothetical protein